MDELRKFLTKLKKLHFWVLCAFLLGLGVGTWFTTAGRLKKEFGGNQSGIQGMFSALDPVRSLTPHPNSRIDEEMQKLITSRQQNVLSAWQAKWNHQSQLLTWPDTLEEDFLKHVQEKFPVMEQIDVKKNPEQDLPQYLRDGFQAYLHKELPKISEFGGAKWKIQMEELIEGDVPVSPTEEFDTSVVDWNQADQQVLTSEFTWKDQQGTTIVPQTLDIYVAQENLWVLRTLMHIIKETNAGADQRHIAPIKRIDFLRFGLSAVSLDNAGKVEPIRSNVATTSTDPTTGLPTSDSGLGATSGGNLYGGDGFAMTGGSGVMGDTPYGSATPGVVLNATDPLGNRYIDETFAPIADGLQLRESVNNPTIERAALGVAKRLPVRMRVRMDTRKIDRLLAACANAPLMLEVKQLRIARPPAPAPAVDKTGTMAPAAAAEPDAPATAPMGADPDDFMMLNMGRRREGRSGGMLGGYSSGLDPESEEMALDRSQRSFPYDEYVEVFGLVYIYNRPNERVIQGAGGAEPSALAGR